MSESSTRQKVWLPVAIAYADAPEGGKPRLRIKYESLDEEGREIWQHMFVDRARPLGRRVRKLFEVAGLPNFAFPDPEDIEECAAAIRDNLIGSEIRILVGTNSRGFDEVDDMRPASNDLPDDSIADLFPSPSDPTFSSNLYLFDRARVARRYCNDLEREILKISREKPVSVRSIENARDHLLAILSEIINVMNERKPS